MDETIIKYFLEGQSPWALLFVVLFYFTIKTNKEREDKHNEQIKALTDQLESKLQDVDRKIDMVVIIWKTLIESELERRKRK